MSIVRFCAVLVLVTAAGCSQSSPTPTPERTGEAEGRLALPQQQAPQKAQPRKQRGAVAPQIDRVALPEGEAEAAPTPIEEGGGCQGEGDEAAKDGDKRVSISIGNAPTSGPADAPVTIVVFSDFQCPFCARAVDTLEVLQTRYGDDLRIVFKNRPLPMHDRAPALARAALAAHEQGRFWDFHDALFDAARMHDKADVEKLADKLGLDVRRFRADLAEPRFAAQVEADDAEGQRLDVRGTPTFFVNGRRITGAQQASAFRTIIDEELRTAGRPVPAAK